MPIIKKGKKKIVLARMHRKGSLVHYGGNENWYSYYGKHKYLGNLTYMWNLKKQTTYPPPHQAHTTENRLVVDRQNKEGVVSEIGKRGQKVQTSSIK